MSLPYANIKDLLSVKNDSIFEYDSSFVVTGLRTSLENFLSQSKLPPPKFFTDSICTAFSCYPFATKIVLDSGAWVLVKNCPSKKSAENQASFHMIKLLSEKTADINFAPSALERKDVEISLLEVKILQLEMDKASLVRDNEILQGKLNDYHDYTKENIKIWYQEWIVEKLPKLTFSGFAKYMQDVHSAFMHALNGNPKSQRSKSDFDRKKKKEIKTELKVEMKPEIKALVKKDVSKDLTQLTGRRTMNSDRRSVINRLNRAPAIIKSPSSPKLNAIVSAIIRCITLPGINLSPMRFKTGYADFMTAAASLENNYDYNWTANSSSSITYPFNSLTSSDCPLLVFKNPLRQHIMFDPNLTNQVENYQAYFGNSNPNNSSVSPIFASSLPTNTITHDFNTKNSVPINPIYWLALSSYAPNGNALPCATRDGKPNLRVYFWMNAGDNVNFTVKSTSAHAALTGYLFSLDQFTSQGDVPDISTTVNPAMVANTAVVWGATPVKQPGYYSMRMTNVDGVFDSIQFASMNFTGSGGMRVCHLMAKDWFQNWGSIGPFRSQGTSMLVSNTAAEAAMQGDITFQQVPANVFWPDMISSFQNFASLKLSQGNKMKAKTGGYCYLKPSDDEDMLKFLAYSDIENGSVVSSYYPLVEEHDYLMVWQFIAPPGSTTALNNQASSVIVTGTYDYKTENRFLEIRKANLNPELIKEAMFYVNKMPQWVENPNHLVELWGKISGRIGKVANFLDEILPNSITEKVSKVGKQYLG